MLLFLLSGLFLLRFAERQFLGLLFQAPPQPEVPTPLQHPREKCYTSIFC